MFYYSLGENKDEYYEFVKAQLHSSNLAPNAIHREMLNLNPVSFITTNYDTLLEDAAIQYCQSFKVISRDKDVPTILGDRFILKLHGDFKYNIGACSTYSKQKSSESSLATAQNLISIVNTQNLISVNLMFHGCWIFIHTLEQIAKNAKAKEHVRAAIAKALTEKNLAFEDSQKLQNILVKHFC